MLVYLLLKELKVFIFIFKRLINVYSGEYSCLTVDLTFKREFSYYLLTIYVPCCMLVIVSWVSFWLDQNAIPARLPTTHIVPFILFVMLLLLIILFSSSVSLPCLYICLVFQFHNGLDSLSVYSSIYLSLLWSLPSPVVLFLSPRVIDFSSVCSPCGRLLICLLPLWSSINLFPPPVVVY